MVVYNILKPPITARYIRILPLEWHSQISLRIEVYGCPGNPKCVGKQKIIIKYLYKEPAWILSLLALLST